MISTFLAHDNRPSSLLMPNNCWSKRESLALLKHLAKSGVQVASSLQNHRSEFSLQHLVVMVDFNCSRTEELLAKANKDAYFKSPYRWLLLNLEIGNSTILDEIEILTDSDVIVTNNIGEGNYDIVEVYKVSPGSDLIYTKRANWNPRQRIIQQLNDIKSSKNEKSVKTEGELEDYRTTKSLSSRRSNLRRHTLTMVNVITDSNDTRKHLTDRLQLHQDSITKMSYSVVSICFEMLNATENLLFTHTWGYRDKNGSWQGIVDHLIKKQADLGTLTIFTQERMEVIDYIAMVGSTAVRFVFREPPLSYITNIFAMPFTGGVWIAILVCVLCCAVFLYFTSRWEATMSMHQFQLDGSWADIIILIIGAVLQQGCTLEPRYAAGRTVTLLLFVALTILYAAYSANIVVLLRAPSSSIRSLNDLLHSPLKAGASDFEYNRYFFKKLNEPIRKEIYDKKIAPKGKKPHFYTMEEGVEKIRQGLFAFHMESNPGYRLIQETYQEDEKCDLVEIDYINEIDPWVPGQKRSPYKDLFKISFIKIRESGIQSCIHHRLHVPRPRCSGTVATFSSVGITDMLPAMLAGVYGALLAPIVLMVELAYHRLTKVRQLQKHRTSIDSTFLRSNLT